ncbi:MAG: IS481 family transposase [Acidobacteriota bacterium]|nr:IS481 family transposase [Acidobacteriota bacterium]
METNVVDERRQFVRDFASGHWSMTELCERYGVTRPTGYKWVARHRAGGDGGLVARSRAPHTCPHRTGGEVEALVVAARRQYGWGAKKLLKVLRTRHPALAWPTRSTLNALLERHHLLRKNRRRRKWTHPGATALDTQQPNQVWPADFKGQFKTGDGHYCYPLTVTDHFSRALLVCRGLSSVKTTLVRPVFRALFREVGLPDAIRTDNGAPFASTGIHGLSSLNVWWMQLGIVHQRISPASPQQNGQHERMHRELKRETARPAAGTSKAQQRRFDAFRRRYNDERPHEGIGDCTPTSLWMPSTRPYPERIARPDYPSHMEVRRVSTAGTFRLHSQQPFLSQTLKGEDIGLEEVGDGIWNIVYYRTLLGKIDERGLLITGV